MDHSTTPFVFVVIAGIGFILEILAPNEVALHLEGPGDGEGVALLWTPARA
jgi:hypothetical protein